jgi:hypothetical protein
MNPHALRQRRLAFIEREIRKGNANAWDVVERWESDRRMTVLERQRFSRAEDEYKRDHDFISSRPPCWRSEEGGLLGYTGLFDGGLPFGLVQSRWAFHDRPFFNKLPAGRAASSPTIRSTPSGPTANSSMSPSPSTSAATGRPGA